MTILFCRCGILCESPVSCKSAKRFNKATEAQLRCQTPLPRKTGGQVRIKILADCPFDFSAVLEVANQNSTFRKASPTPIRLQIKRLRRGPSLIKPVNYAVKLDFSLSFLVRPNPDRTQHNSCQRPNASSTNHIIFRLPLVKSPPLNPSIPLRDPLSSEHSHVQPAE